MGFEYPEQRPTKCVIELIESSQLFRAKVIAFFKSKLFKNINQWVAVGINYICREKSFIFHACLDLSEAITENILKTRFY